MLRQYATTAITALCAASIRLTMAAMLGRLVAQLKMPRLDAYLPTAPGHPLDKGCPGAEGQALPGLLDEAERCALGHPGLGGRDGLFEGVEHDRVGGVLVDDDAPRCALANAGHWI